MLHVYFWSDKPLNMFSLPMMKICHEIKEATVCMRENEKIKAFSDGLGTRNNTAYHTQNAVEKKNWYKFKSSVEFNRLLQLKDISL